MALARTSGSGEIRSPKPRPRCRWTFGAPPPVAGGSGGSSTAAGAALNATSSGASVRCGSTAASDSLDAAARALYGWGLQSAHGVPPVERRTFLSLGRLCHLAAVAPDEPELTPQSAQAAEDAALPVKCCGHEAKLPPMPPKSQPLEALPRVRGVPVGVEGERREIRVDVGLGDVANEQYALRVQEEAVAILPSLLHKEREHAAASRERAAENAERAATLQARSLGLRVRG